MGLRCFPIIIITLRIKIYIKICKTFFLIFNWIKIFMSPEIFLKAALKWKRVERKCIESKYWRKDKINFENATVLDPSNVNENLIMFQNELFLLLLQLNVIFKSYLLILFEIKFCIINIFVFGSLIIIDDMQYLQIHK